MALSLLKLGGSHDLAGTPSLHPFDVTLT